MSQPKKHIILILLFFLSISMFSETRKTQKINEGWKFILADGEQFSKKDFDDSNWKELNLPHDWSIQQPNKRYSGRNAFLPGGIGWYRKKIFIDKKAQQKEFRLVFDGVYKNSKIWINGHYIGNQNDGYTSFYHNITSYINFGEKNTIAVKVDNSIQPNCRWYSGSGIYRNVWLVTTNKLAVSQWGTNIITSEISKKSAKVTMKTSLRNYANQTNFSLETQIYDDKGTKIKEVVRNFKIGNRTSTEYQQEFTIDVPKLWSVNSPYLYLAKTIIKINSKVVDEYQTQFGVRKIHFDAQKGFFLNDKNIKFKGVCLHHEAGVFGAAVPIQIWERRLQKLKDIGCNAIRTAHNPTAPEFLELCDKMGFLVMNEFVDKWIDTDSWYTKKGTNNFFNPKGFADLYFEYEWKQNYTTTIQRDRNHPSVVIWSVGNENYSPNEVAQKASLKKYTSFVRSLDATRPIISGMERGKDGVVSEKVKGILNTTEEMDLIAMNYGEQWLPFIKKNNPQKPFVSTESYTYFNSSPEKRFANLEKSPWLDVLANDFNMGLFLWVGIDYLGESNKWPKLGSDSGLLDRAGIEKTRSYLYEAFWSDKPTVKIAIYEGNSDDFSSSGRWGWPAIHQNWNLKNGENVDIATYTNCDVVELYLNNKKIGSKKRKDFSNWIVKWKNIAYKKGTLKAIGFIDGRAVCEDIIATTTKPKYIQTKTFTPKYTSDEIIQIEVSVVDKKKNRITSEEVALSFDISEGATIIGLDNGDMNNHQNFINNKQCITNKGKCFVVIKRNKKTNSQLKIFSKNIKTHHIKLM